MTDQEKIYEYDLLSSLLFNLLTSGPSSLEFRSTDTDGMKVYVNGKCAYTRSCVDARRLGSDALEAIVILLCSKDKSE